MPGAMGRRPTTLSQIRDCRAVIYAALPMRKGVIAKHSPPTEDFMKVFRIFTAIALMFLTFSHANAMSKDIVDTAAGAGQFKTLVAAIEAAGLVDTLKGDGPFTVFAPTDEAFAKLPAGTVDDLLKPENKDKLIAILTYRVVPGKIMAGDIAGKSTEVKTVQGDTLNVDATNGVTVDTAKVVKADIVTTNGVIHVIDSVVMPN